MHGDLVAVGCASGAVLLLLCASFRAPVLLQTLCGGHLRRVTGDARVRVGLGFFQTVKLNCQAPRRP
jgi:hypothetical protein